ncbi:MAG: hypothetical protein GXO10_02495 [Crenarchaeota archaeon]|nr:hypothetical protein [Thermoproteota archaeon]
MSPRSRLMIALAVAAAVVMAVTIIYAVHVRPACRAAEYIINSTEKILNYDNILVKKLNITNKKILEELNKSNTYIIEAQKLVKENRCSAALEKALHSLNIAEHVYVIVAERQITNRTYHRLFARAVAEALAHIYMRYLKKLGIHNETVYRNIEETCKYCTRECSNITTIRRTFECVMKCYEKRLRISNILRIVYEYRTYIHVNHIIEKYLKILNESKIVKIAPPEMVNGVCRPGIIYVKIGNRTILKTFNCTKEGLEEFHNYTRMIMIKFRKIEARARALYTILPLFINNRTLVSKLRKDLKKIIEKAQELKNEVQKYVNTRHRRNRIKRGSSQGSTEVRNRNVQHRTERRRTEARR